MSADCLLSWSDGRSEPIMETCVCENDHFLEFPNENLPVYRQVDLLGCKDSGVRGSYMCLRLSSYLEYRKYIFPLFGKRSELLTSNQVAFKSNGSTKSMRAYKHTSVIKERIPALLLSTCTCGVEYIGAKGCFNRLNAAEILECPGL
jgi:hypothetical protein